MNRTDKGTFARTSYLIQFFEYEHLPDELQSISKPFGDLARYMDETLPSNPEKTTMLRKLLEAKDCAVRANMSTEVATDGPKS